MAKRIMILGTMSSAGKSLIATGLCRIFHQDGFRTAPFKSQNMALNSFITRDGLEMGRAQVTQAEAACAEPSVLMNPILLKPTSDMGSQVIVRGEVFATMHAQEYYKLKNELRPVIIESFNRLAAENEIIVIEGAGSPAEINLNEGDFVNMGMAKIADSPALLVADIDRGGVFASIYGTVMLLGEEERARIKGIIINKFRGDIEILRPGLRMIEELTGVPVLGVIPYLRLDIDDEDSITERFGRSGGAKPIDIAVLCLPRISNATDFNALDRLPPVRLRYVRSVKELGEPDIIIIPGTKSTMDDLLWLRERGLEAAIKKHASKGLPVIGICGGYQMLGMKLADPEGVERGGELRGMELLPVETRFGPEKVRTRVDGTAMELQGPFAALSGARFSGYEIHMGETEILEGAVPFSALSSGKPDGAVRGNVFGSYVHGLFDGELGARLVKALLIKKGLSADFSEIDTELYKQAQYDALASAMRESLDMAAIYEIMDGER